jgi:hypothetical protein
LREWATKELQGYDGADEVPPYRKVGAPIFADAVTGNSIIKGQRISPSALPEFARDAISEQYVFGIGVGEIEALIRQAHADGGSVKLSLPMAAELAQVMDEAVGDPFQKITGLYWRVSTSSLEGVVDQVKNTLAQLIAELRAATPSGEELPAKEAAANAVSIVAHRRARVTVTNAQSGAGPATASSNEQPTETGFWTTGRKIGAAIVGLAGIASAVLAGFQVYGSPF